MTARERWWLRAIRFTANGRLIRRFVWCSYMMHVHDGFAAEDVPSARRPGYIYPQV